MEKQSEDPKGGERIAKVIARSGVCSRRDAEKLILEGKVSVDGQRITSPALNVSPEQSIRVSGKPIQGAAETRLWLYYKPLGLITSHRDEAGRPTVFDALPKDMPRVISVGRLDLNTEGLMLLTNDGALARHMELPSTGWRRRYRVRIYGPASPEALAKLAKGVTVEGVRYGPVEVTLEKAGEKQGKDAKNVWAMVSITEGKNREIRKVFEHIGCKVSRLIRIAYGPFQLGTLKPGDVRAVPHKMLAEQLGKKLKGFTLGAPNA
jgi:23S rRNA pseudouridine2605 synthase